MLTVPRALLDRPRLRAGAKVGLAVQKGRLVVDPHRRPHYTLAELLKPCNPKRARNKGERKWLSDRAVGRELI